MSYIWNVQFINNLWLHIFTSRLYSLNVDKVISCRRIFMIEYVNLTTFSLYRQLFEIFVITKNIIWSHS